ncbi:MAG: nickel-type superoxide dismutase maturation protease [Chloroflexota bacterium]|nr:nickel-type superoxide dismutase maturation protease [Chloroflexota bacterium]
MEIGRLRRLAGGVVVPLGVAVALASLRVSRAYVVEGDSMHPTLHDGDYVHALRLTAGARRRLLRPDTIVVARRPDAPEITVIKRVAAQDQAGLTLLGDHPALSTDSRHFGPVDPAAVEAVVWLRYWPLSRARLLAGPFRPGRAAAWTDHVS